MRLPALMLPLVLCFLGSVVASTPLHAGDAPQATDPRPVVGASMSPLVIAFSNGLLSVRVHKMPWHTVLQEVERHTGIGIRALAPLAGTLTHTFDALPLEQGLRQLFRDANTVFLYTKERRAGATVERLTRVWLLSQAGGAGGGGRLLSASAGATVGEDQAGPGALVASTQGMPEGEAEAALGEDQEEQFRTLHALAWQGDEAALRQAVFAADQTVQATALELLAELDPQGTVALLGEALQRAQPEQRLQALHLLTTQGDEEAVRAALSAALGDEDVVVKRYAMQALAERGGVGALASLRLTLRDPDPGIRLSLLEILLTTDEGRPLLQEALADADETVRAFAAFWLAKEEER